MKTKEFIYFKLVILNAISLIIIRYRHNENVREMTNLSETNKWVINATHQATLKFYPHYAK